MVANEDDQHECRYVGRTRKSGNQSNQQRLEQTEEENDEPLEDQLGENCNNLFESRRRHGH